MSVILTKSEGIFQLHRDRNLLGQARDLERLLENVCGEHTEEKFPPEAFLHTADVLRALLRREAPGQVLTYDPHK